MPFACYIQAGSLPDHLDSQIHNRLKLETISGGILTSNKDLLQFVRQALSETSPIEKHLVEINSLLLISTPVILLFALFNYNHGHEILADIELAIGLAYTAVLFLFRPQRMPRVSSSLFIAGLVTLFTALLIDGGIDNTGIYWGPIFPFVALIVCGLRRGSIITIALLGIILLALGFNYEGLLALQYSPYQLMIILIAFVICSMIAFCLSAIQEFNARQLSLAHQQLTDTGQELRKAHADLETLVYERTSKLAEAKKSLEKEVQQKDLANERLRSTQEKFFQAQKMEAIGTLVGGIAHDFNNMLSGITANLYLVKTRITEPQVTDRLEKVDALIMHAADMIRQMLTFARKDNVQLKEFDLSLFLKEAYKLANVSISEHIQTSISIPDQDLLIRGDTTQLQQVVMNLMNNARDALADVKEPSIDISLRSFQPDEHFRHQFPEQNARKYACISVRDNGHGIPKEKLAQIFEPFFTTKSVGHGTGLGLAMIHGAVESHGGVIDVKSSIGHGTTFFIYLPIVTQEKSSRQLAGQTAAIARGNGETLLLVDDDAYLREANADVLQSLNYKIMVATNGKEAVQLFEQHAPDIDLILMDVVMPEMGGADAAKHIRKIDPRIGIIFMTGYDKDKTLDGAITGEWENVLLKPLTIDKLSATVHQHLVNRTMDTIR